MGTRSWTQRTSSESLARSTSRAASRRDVPRLGVARAANMPPQARSARGAPNAHARSSDVNPLGPNMSDAEHITRALRGTWYGHYGVAFCPAHDNTRTPALSLRGDSSGHLLTYCFAGCSFAEVMAALRRKRI